MRRTTEDLARRRILADASATANTPVTGSAALSAARGAHELYDASPNAVSPQTRLYLGGELAMAVDDPGSRVTIHTRADMDQAAAEWLAAAASSAAQVVGEWKAQGVAWLRTGTLFSTVTLNAELVHAAVGSDEPECVADCLEHVLEGTPVFFTPGGVDTYTALLTPHAVRAWRVPDTVAAGQGHQVPVPFPAGEPDSDAARWVVPMAGPGLLGSPALLAALVALGRLQLSRKGDAAHE
ncbi:hypothetical protein [Streptomyces kronopolitis]|uniref:hypothetical protein n=1 Tax=Streptomyces kronopolitis TaxID=1612435 RepID=UPI003D966E35